MVEAQEILRRMSCERMGWRSPREIQGRMTRRILVATSRIVLLESLVGEGLIRPPPRPSRTRLETYLICFMIRIMVRHPRDQLLFYVGHSLHPFRCLITAEKCMRR